MASARSARTARGQSLEPPHAYTRLYGSVLAGIVSASACEENRGCQAGRRLVRILRSGSRLDPRDDAEEAAMLLLTDLLGLARGAESVVDLAVRSSARYARNRPGRAAVVVWSVCRHCNMSCPHCDSATSSRRSPQDLSTAEILRILGELAAGGVGTVVWSGGEPLLREDLAQLVARTHELGMTAELSTNGVLLAEQARALAAAGLAYACVSLDAPGQRNDGYRRLAGGFDLAARGLGAARVAGIETGVRTTVSRANARDVGAMLELAGRLGADRFHVSHLVHAGRASGVAAEGLSPSESRSLLVQLFDRVADAEGAGPRVVTDGNDSAGPLFVRWVAGRFGAAAAERVTGALLRRGGNSAGEQVLAIDHRGRVHPDEFWPSAVLGDLRAQSFEEILGHPLRAELAGRVARLGGRCGGCRFVALCRGSHRERAIGRSRDLWAPDPACVMTDEEVGAVRFAAGALA